MTRDLGPQNVFMDRFVLEPKVQRVWDIPHATWFTLMGVGGGVFVLARLLGVEDELGTLLGIPIADVISFVAIAVGGLILIADLGRPLRFVRAVLNPGTSWISRGAIADFVFLIAGGLLVLPDLELGSAQPFAGLPWDAGASDGFGRVLEIVALAAAVVVMFYAGQVLAEPRAIPYWHSPLIPAQFLLSSLATSLALVMILETTNDEPIPAGQCWLLAGLLAALLVAIVVHLRTNADRPGKAESIERLTQGIHRSAFLGGVVGLGTLLPLVLAVIAAAAGGTRDAVGVVAFVCTVPAGFFLRLLTLRVGIFPPVRSMVPVRS
jgi:formate-dependent nitrite reductase membrane component NrfD